MAPRDHDSRSQLPSQYFDSDPTETTEWRDSLSSVIETAGPARARYLMLELQRLAAERDLGVPDVRHTDYINSIAPQDEPDFPATRRSSAESGPTSGGMPPSWFTAHSAKVSALAGTSPPTPPRHRYTKSG